MFSSLRPLAILTLLVLLLTSAYGAGKIRGKVKDKQTGEALVGASIIINGTSQGASTDVNGEYIILNIPPGTYSLRTSYLGYQTTVISNVIVNTDLSTEINFDLSSEAVSLQAVQIVAEAPLVNKSATNTIVQLKAEQIENIPVRGVQGLVALSGGIVSQDGNIFVRGGRSGEVAFYVDGVLVNNPMNHLNQLTVINNAIEEVSSQIGGMTAEYGNALSGVVNTSTKVGTSSYKFGVEVITDGFLSSEKKFLNTYSYGLNEYILTASGPIIPGNQRIKFFVAGSRNLNRSAASFLDGMKFPFSIDSTAIQGADFIVTNRDSGKTKPGVAEGSTGRRTALTNLLNSLDLKGGSNFGGLQNDTWSLNGNVYFDFTNFNVKVGGTYSANTSFGQLGKGLAALRIADNSYRPGKTETVDASSYVKFTHVIDQSTYYTLNANYYSFFQEAGDILLFDNYTKYGDPRDPHNTYLIGPSKEQPSFNLYGFTVNSPGFISQKNYTKASRTSTAGRLDFVRQVSNVWEFKTGAEVQRYTIRSYNLPAFNLYRTRFDKSTATDWVVYNGAGVNTYGYDIYGNEFDGGNFTDKTGFSFNLKDGGPRHPINLGAYLQNKIEMPDLIINLGFRFDYIDPGTKKYDDAQNIGLYNVGGIPLVSDSSFVDQDITMQISPRIGFSFPVTERTVFHAEYGKFIAQSALNNLYNSTMALGNALNRGNAIQMVNPNLKPERTTDYQIGFRQQLGDVSAFDLSFFYKDTKDLIVIRQVYASAGAPHGSYISNVNGDFGTVRGLTFRFDVRRLNRISFNANYTLQSAQATGSATGTHFNIAWQDASGPGGLPYFPVIPSATEFDRTHFGNISFDYRYAENDGPILFNSKILERFGANFLFTFASGRRYTKDQVSSAFGDFSVNAPIPYENLNASSAPWTFTLDLRLNKAFKLFEGTDLDLYLWVNNVLNTKNVANIYSATGLPDNDGYFSTLQGDSFTTLNGEKGKQMYEYLVDNENNYGTPRIIRLGAKITF